MAIQDEIEDIVKIRWANLDRLRGQESAVAFGRRLGMPTSFPKHFTQGPARRPVGERVARQVEAKLGLERGSLDQPHGIFDIAHFQAVMPQDGSSVSLVGLSSLQSGVVTTLAGLCRQGKLSDRMLVALLGSWSDLMD